MELSQTVGLDRNTLPYVVRDAALGAVSVRFAPLTQSDIPEISGPPWLGATFTQTWIGFADDGRTFKLVKTTEAGQNIKGVVRLGSVPLGSRALRDSLLEVVPTNRYNRYKMNSSRPLTGIGRVLMARLIVEGYNRGGNGALIVRAHDDAIGFYQAIGGKRLGSGREFLLPSTTAETVFASATL